MIRCWRTVWRANNLQRSNFLTMQNAPSVLRKEVENAEQQNCSLRNCRTKKSSWKETWNVGVTASFHFYAKFRLCEWCRTIWWTLWACQLHWRCQFSVFLLVSGEKHHVWHTIIHKIFCPWVQEIWKKKSTTLWYCRKWKSLFLYPGK